jgi:hypothetical protein
MAIFQRFREMALSREMRFLSALHDTCPEIRTVTLI